jgi:hypothetical protein
VYVFYSLGGNQRGTLSRGQAETESPSGWQQKVNYMKPEDWGVGGCFRVPGRLCSRPSVQFCALACVGLRGSQQDERAPRGRSCGGPASQPCGRERERERGGGARGSQAMEVGRGGRAVKADELGLGLGAVGAGWMRSGSRAETVSAAGSSPGKHP